MISIEAAAKVNLTLRVLARRADGYHSLETVFCALSLADTVRVEAADEGVELRIDGSPPTTSVDDNLVVRAARRFGVGDDRGLAGVRLELIKRIPAAAGLGGGSSDAAATLLALRALVEETGKPGAPPDRDALLGWGAELGSDVPFFLCGSPLALAWGRGERLLALPPLPSRPVLVANPGIALPTPDAFRALAASRGDAYAPPAAAIDLEELRSWEAIAAHAVNDFEPFAVSRIPVVGRAISALREAGATIALLAGSGASVFGVFPTEESRDAAEEPVRALGLRTWRAETLEKMPLPRRE